MMPSMFKVLITHTDIHEVHHFAFVYSNGAKITGHFILIQRQGKLFPLSVILLPQTKYGTDDYENKYIRFSCFCQN